MNLSLTHPSLLPVNAVSVDGNLPRRCSFACFHKMGNQVVTLRAVVVYPTAKRKDQVSKILDEECVDNTE